MLFIVLTVTLAIVVMIALAYPIVRQAQGQAKPAMTSAQETLEELLADREAAFQAIRDLQFDHEVGKITDADLAVFETSLKLHAANTLRKLDAWESGVDRSLSATLERRVAAHRATLSRPGQPCPQCGRPASAEDSFCRACGAAVTPAPARTRSVALVCPNCGRNVTPDDRFCPKCGQPVAQLASHA